VEGGDGVETLSRPFAVVRCEGPRAQMGSNERGRGVAFRVAAMSRRLVRHSPAPATRLRDDGEGFAEADPADLDAYSRPSPRRAT
jgi:hypothetical protein